MSEFVFMDIRPNRAFIPVDEFAIRSGIPLDCLERLMDDDDVSFVSFNKTRYLSWDRFGTQVTPMDVFPWLDDLYRQSAIDKKSGKA